MHRLLQGDVGSGKTVVALATLLYGIQGGHQGALLVPTEVLAEQHVAATRALLSGLHVEDPGRLTQRRELVVALLTSEISGSERDRVYQGLREGTIDLVVGTHALLSAEVRFASLGVVVIDEQHRFGVDQRALLRERASLQGGHDPDLLVMTATPIPRTAAMTVYGDLDYSELDEMPPGRTPIRTRWVSEESDEPRVWSRVRAEVARGAQAFVVCARVHPDESEGASGAADLEGPDLEGLVYLHEEGEAEPQLFGTTESAPPKRRARSAIEEFDRLREGELAGLRVGLLHGQMRADDKERVMADLREGFLDVLVATTVIEVGVDIPRATVMVIADADRFGIAQLHQLRGRVGRGGGEAFCYLLGYEVGEQARARLSAMVATTDGFALAEVDLELRGEGTLLANRQRGRNDLRLASLRRDRELVTLARGVAVEMIEADPTLSQHELLAEELPLFVDEEGAQYLARS
jgi:ATP-dependent DNA helicase RecG